MSVNYADGLSPYEHKGKCGMPEKFDEPDILKDKIQQLAKYFRESKHIVCITGAGISTSAGIPDFRGPKGVWTLEKQGQKPIVNVTFEKAKPTLTHLALVALERKNYIKFVISQNVDGLHLRSGFPCNRISELHGNMFVEECERCHSKYVKNTIVKTMALQLTGDICSLKKPTGRFCRGKLRDTILDWEDNLSESALEISEKNCKIADLCICLGTSLQIIPCGNMPLKTKKNKGKIVIVNLQPTKHDKNADLLINAYVDDVMRGLCEELGVEIQPFKRHYIKLKTIWPDDKKSIEFPAVVVDESLQENSEDEKEYQEEKKEKLEEAIKEELTEDLKRKLVSEGKTDDLDIKQIKKEEGEGEEEEEKGEIKTENEDKKK